MKKYLIAIILLLVAVVIGMTIVISTQKKNSVSVLETQKIETSSETSKDEEKKPTKSSVVSSESAQTSVVVKQIYTKNGAQYAELDYTSSATPEEWMTARINAGKCTVSGFTKEQTLALAKTVTQASIDSSRLAESPCGFTAGDVYAVSHTTNENPLIRTLKFSPDFKILNTCNGRPTLSDIQTQAAGASYQYDIVDTRGYSIKKATISNGLIQSFDFETGCAN